MPTDAAALQISTQPSSCTFTEQTSGLARPSRPQARTASIRRRGSGWIQRPVVTPISMHGTSARIAATASPTCTGSRVSSVSGPRGCTCTERDAEAGDGTGVAGEVTGLHRQRGVRVFRTRAVQRRLQHSPNLRLVSVTPTVTA